ncbi:MAG: binding domain protein [Petroclostridium sp.]|jgi:S1 RNA binding domain protein|uniref:S1 RNA-binding domain-containing protein n=1 Tax=Petroclostridium xylanilyticum TaxID=1792311 RepID=UPI000B98A346|nr:S1 RNA-binding domain-containing protein [Petroclostridium xylanilyticum]MBZ4645086.1 putative RNA-binding protein with ribosomal protein domain [Clostridia bacterium]MDK2810532.1 binding domain protein [Petroclostridium sp.]
MLVEVGKVVEGKVTGITGFGAFVQLPDGKTGLVHISEVAVEYVKDIKKHLKENQVVKVKVLSVDNDGKISLSIKKALENESNRSTRSSSRPPVDIDWSRRNNNENLSFEDKLLKFKQDSDERMQDLKRSIESKRGGGYKRSANIF